MSATAVKAPPEVPQPEVPQRGDVEDAGRGGWFVKITIVVIVILWSIPTLGVLITSFRPEDLVNTSGWWTRSRTRSRPRSGRSRTTGSRWIKAGSATRS